MPVGARMEGSLPFVNSYQRLERFDFNQMLYDIIVICIDDIKALIVL